MQKHEIRDPIDVLHVQKCMTEFAAAVGFPKRECGELAIVVSELTSNILKYGVRGSIEMGAMIDARGMGVVLTASDCGPHFRDLSAAIRDGYDDRGPIDPMCMFKRGGIGGGLGAVLRLTHSFRLEPLPQGKRIHVIRYLDLPLVHHGP